MIQVPESVMLWLATGEKGLSSEAIVNHIWGAAVSRFAGKSHPYDPDDLKRCLKLLEASPETKARLAEMRGVSHEWKALVDNWATLERLFLAEAGDLEWSSRKPAPITYGAMQRCFQHTSDGEQRG